MLILRIALLGMFVYIYQWPLEKIQTGAYKKDELIFVVGLIAVTMFPAYLLWTLLKVLWVRISAHEGKIHVHYLFKSVEAYSNDIEGYYRTFHNTRVKHYNGLLIKLKSGKVVEVSEYNLKSIDDVVDFLKDYKIPYKGIKNSWFPFTRRI
jgi:hypothetical protein